RRDGGVDRLRPTRSDRRSVRIGVRAHTCGEQLGPARRSRRRTGAARDLRHRRPRPCGASTVRGMTVDLAAIRLAQEHGTGLVEHTPVIPSATMSDLTQADVVLKAENLQRTGAFKIRGAMSTLASL